MVTQDSKRVTIDISSLMLLKIVLIFLAVVFLFYIRDIFLIVFVALILAAALDPAVDWMQRRRIPRPIGILLIYFALITFLAGAVYMVVPPIVTEVNQLSRDFPFYWDKVTTSMDSFQDYSSGRGWDDNIQKSIEAVQANLGKATESVFNTVVSFFGGIISFFIILVITFYMIVEEQALKRIIRSVVPDQYQPYFTNLFNRIQDKIGLWLRGQLLLSLIMFLMVWVTLSVLQVKYALVLALFAGVMELIPYFGPFIGAIPAVFIAFTQSPMLAFWVIVAYIIIQQFDNEVTVPKVMQKAVGLNPVIVIIVVLIGAKIAGILGIILAIPVTTAFSIVVGDLIEIKSRRDD